jgi:hypothetical protein
LKGKEEENTKDEFENEDDDYDESESMNSRRH